MQNDQNTPIDPDSAFILYACCEVVYSGRAESLLPSGQYLIVHKADGTMLIHSALKNPPRNYQGPGAKLTIDGNIIISTRKKETIKITISKIISHTILSDWSENKVTISKTEKDLVKKLHDNWQDYFDVKLKSIVLEYPTEHGPIDFLGIDDNDIYHVVEVKRKSASLGNCSQLNRYIETFANVKVVGYIASPAISKNAREYLTKHNNKWINITF